MMFGNQDPEMMQGKSYIWQRVLSNTGPHQDGWFLWTEPYKLPLLPRR